MLMEHNYLRKYTLVAVWIKCCIWFYNKNISQNIQTQVP